jgi:hypothetical protein
MDGMDCGSSPYYEVAKSTLPSEFFGDGDQEEIWYAYTYIFCLLQSGVIDKDTARTYILQATGIWLDLHAKDRGTYRQTSETDTALRARLRSYADTVNPQSLIRNNVLDVRMVNGIPDSSTHSYAVLYDDGSHILQKVGDGTIINSGVISESRYLEIRWLSLGTGRYDIYKTVDASFATGLIYSANDITSLRDTGLNGDINANPGTIVAIPAARIISGETFTLETGSIYEFRHSGSAGLGHIGVSIASATTATDVAAAIVAQILLAEVVITATNLAGVVSIISTDGTLMAGMSETVADTGFQIIDAVVRTVPVTTLVPTEGTVTTILEAASITIPSGYPGMVELRTEKGFLLDRDLIIQAIPGNLINDAETFSIEDPATQVTHVFEFNKTGGFGGGHEEVAITDGDSAATVAIAISEAIQDAMTGATAQVTVIDTTKVRVYTIAPYTLSPNSKDDTVINPGFSMTGGRQGVYISRGYRIGRKPLANDLIIILPPNTTQTVVTGIAQAIRNKRGAGIPVSLEVAPSE